MHKGLKVNEYFVKAKAECGRSVESESDCSVFVRAVLEVEGRGAATARYRVVCERRAVSGVCQRVVCFSIVLVLVQVHTITIIKLFELFSSYTSYMFDSIS